MKQFFKQYGGVALGILAVLVLIAMITPVGNIIKTSLQGTATKFSSSMHEQLDGAMNATASAQNNTLKEPNPYAAKITSVQTLYNVGETNLTDDDIVTVNGIDCYVLQVDATKAELITKDIYNVRFDTGGHTSIEVEGHIGTESGYTDKTYDYKYSTLRTWMNDFYVNKLGADSRILPTTITYYTSDTDSSNLNNYATGTISDQYVFALDAKEAKRYAYKFGWNYSNKQVNDDGSLSTYNSNYLWTTAGYNSNYGSSNAWNVRYSGRFDYSNVNNLNPGARPVFWISLE